MPLPNQPPAGLQREKGDPKQNLGSADTFQNFPVPEEARMTRNLFLERVPAMYPNSAFRAFLAFLALRKMNNLRAFKAHRRYDSPRRHNPQCFDNI